MRKLEFISRLKEELEKAYPNASKVIDGDTYSLRIQPSLKWQLINEYFELKIHKWPESGGPGLTHLRFQYIDPSYFFTLPDTLQNCNYPLLEIRNSTGEIMDDILVAKTQTLAEELLTSTIVFTQRSLNDGIVAANRIIALGAEPRIEDFNYILTKWPYRPSCAHLIKLLIYHFPDNLPLTLRIGELMGVSNLVRSIQAALELR